MQAYVQYLEEQMENQRNVVLSLSSQLDATRSQLEQARVQIKSLECTLHSERLQHNSSTQPSHSTPAITNTSGDSLSCGQIDTQLSDVSDGCPTVSKPKSRKSVSFAMTKAASEGNLMQLRNQGKLDFPSLKDQTKFRHSITFGDHNLYSGFLDVEHHSNVTNKFKERKRKTRKQREKSDNRKKSENNSDSPSNSDVVLRTKGNRKREKRDSGIIHDSFNTNGTDSDS